MEGIMMSLCMHWAEQTLLEVTCAVQEDDDQIVSEAVLSLIEFLYSLEYEVVVDEDRAEQYALKVLPEEWHLMIKEAAGIKRGYTDLSLFSSKKQRSESAGAFAAYVIQYYNERYGLFLNNRK
jgi:hypothetical protein